MRISTRTPEGEPLECRICGKRSYVLITDPPRDTVCPGCGCFAWVRITNAVSPETIDLDYRSVAALATRLSQCESRISESEALSRGLNTLLVPDQVVIWGVCSREATDDDLIQLAQHGGDGDRTFVQSIAETRAPIVRHDETSEGFRFKFGTPLLRRTSNRLVGAIEISYTRKFTRDTEDDIIRVVRSLAAVSTSKEIRKE